MSSDGLAKLSLRTCRLMMVVAVAGFIVTLVLNAFFLDKYNAYGEVPIPGSGSLHLPRGEVTVSLHTVVIGGPNGGGLPVPPLGVTITPPDGVAATGGDGKHRQHNDGQQRCARASVGGSDSRRRHLQHHDRRPSQRIHQPATGLWSLELVTAFWSGSSWPFSLWGWSVRSCQGGGRVALGARRLRRWWRGCSHVACRRRPPASAPAPLRNPAAKASGSSGSKLLRRCGIPVL